MLKTHAMKSETAFLQDLDKPSLHALSYALRHPDTWPAGFVWDFSNCTTCAMGLAHQLWNQIPNGGGAKASVSGAARSFALPYAEAKAIFLGSAEWMPFKTMKAGWLRTKTVCDMDAVTPEMVADQIDKYLAERAE